MPCSGPVELKPIFLPPLRQLGIGDKFKVVMHQKTECIRLKIRTAALTGLDIRGIRFDFSTFFLVLAYNRYISFTSMLASMLISMLASMLATRQNYCPPWEYGVWEMAVPTCISGVYAICIPPIRSGTVPTGCLLCTYSYGTFLGPRGNTFITRESRAQTSSGKVENQKSITIQVGSYGHVISRVIFPRPVYNNFQNIRASA
ncbi:hypothetical protein BGX38DRAFT_646228 [Terfezia claveryi]|nr:hypothetical protein BGX38DRAFT_646228 [Terfezia claveryi]